ncbi:phosphotransferase [Bacillus nakamurai]|uniref:phosphotransferase n=1 Tax=Bacillus nakamurai TaxID=1793963 RepID=UPI001E4532A6|nr:phosphotransferase [Bacillus nakamurai]MCC9022136.1 aminoglycoside phosphotransferase family protein [Bacillus nakamurai]
MHEIDSLYDAFQKMRIDEKLSYSLGERAAVDPDEITCLKSTNRSAIYKLLVRKKSGTAPLILKVYNTIRHKNAVEINIYNKARSVLSDLLPDIYLIEENGHETWVFMEFVSQIRGQLTFHPKHFGYIIPSVAELHSRTFENEDIPDGKWRSWLPVYDSGTMRKERNKQIKKTAEFMDRALEDERTKEIVKPHYRQITTLLHQEGPDFFPELIQNGSAITHGDLHMQNICAHNVFRNEPWDIQFIDWESAKYAPVWFDMVVLVEILLGFRKDWSKHAEDIRTYCVKVYTKEMKKRGIHFRTPPMTLYKMAYLQRTLEKGIHTQLRRIFDNRGGELLPYHLDKVSQWGRELGL